MKEEWVEYLCWKEVITHETEAKPIDMTNFTDVDVLFDQFLCRTHDVGLVNEAFPPEKPEFIVAYNGHRAAFPVEEMELLTLCRDYALVSP